MDRLRLLGKFVHGIGIWVIMLLPWGRNRMLQKARMNGIAEGQFLLAKQLANMNREHRRAALRHIVRNFKKK